MKRSETYLHNAYLQNLILLKTVSHFTNKTMFTENT